MGLFDKKYCDICGAQIGLLGNRKLEDGNCCKECASKLSPFFSDRRRSTVADIKAQLEYRAANAEAIKSFFATRSLGSDMKVHVDERNGKFIVTRSNDWNKANPDIIDIRNVKAVKVDVSEDKDEIFDEDAEGNEVSFEPARFEYEYQFDVTIEVQSPWFDSISFEVSKSSDRPTSPDSEAYAECAATCHAIRCALMPGRYSEDDMVPFDSSECTYVAAPGEEAPAQTETGAEEWVCPKCGKTASGNFCISCGTARPVEDAWFCPNCGTKSEGNFCVKCGTAKPAASTVWFCPNCGTKVDGNFCPKCGKSRPQ